MGCGWLGLPLAKSLLKDEVSIKGSTTSASKLILLDTEGIKGFTISLNEDNIKGNIQDFLSDLHCLVINIPPGLRKKNAGNYVSKMKLLLKELQKVAVKKIVFISSTSVYGDIEGEITEATKPQPTTESGKQLLESELLFSTNKNLDVTIVRFGGLIGKDRHPIYHIAGKKELKNGEELINLIHLDDCIHMIKTIIKNGYWSTIFNGVYPTHPTKKEYYTSEAIKRNLQIPEYVSFVKNVNKKIIINKNFLNKCHLLYTPIIS